MVNSRRLSEFPGVVSSGGGIEGQIMDAISAIEPGGTLIIDANSFAGASGQISREYAVFSPVFISKSIFIEGESPDVRIVNKATGDTPVFLVSSTASDYFFGFKNLTLVSGSQGIAISSSVNNINISKIENINFYNQSSASLKIESPSIECKIRNIIIQGHPLFGIYLSSSANYDSFSLVNSTINGTINSAIYWSKSEIGSGSNNIREVELINNTQGICVNNVRYYETNVEYINNISDYVLSGTSIRLTGSSGGGGGGVTVHSDLSGLSVDDHKQYLHVSGTRSMSANLNMGGNNITNVNLVDGVDVGILDGIVSSHIGNLNNPHQTSIANIGQGTLSQLNAAISDADLNSLAQFNALSAAFQSISGTVLTTTGSLQTLSSTFQSFSSSVQSTTGSLQSVSGTLLDASSSFATVSSSFSPLSNSFVAFQVSYFNSSASFSTTSASFSSLSSTYPALSNSFSAISSSFKSSSGSFSTTSASFSSLSSTYSPLSLSFSSISASFIGFSGSHAVRHLSGGVDPINIQLMQASGVAGNMIFMTSGTANASIVAIPSSTFALQADFIAFTASNLVNSASFAATSASFSTLSAAFSTVSSSFSNLSSTYPSLSNSFGAISATLKSFSASHGSNHNSGSIDPLDVQSLRGNGVSINQLLISNGLGGWTTVASQSVGTPPGAPAAHASTHISGGNDPINIQLMQASGVAGNMIFMTSGTANASIVAIASSTFALQVDFSNASASFAIVSSSFSRVSGSFSSLSSTYSPLSNSFATISATFKSFSASHGSNHLSGGIDPLDVQNLRGNGVTINQLLISNGAGGWTTVASQSVGTPPGVPAAHASSHLSGGSDPVDAQLLRGNGLAINRLLMTDGLGGWTTVASQSVGSAGVGGGITTVLSSTSENYSIISGVVGNTTLYLKNLVAMTAGIGQPGGYIGVDYPPAILSSSDTTIYIKRTPLRNIFYDRDDFTAGSPSGTLGFTCITAAGGTITTSSVDPPGNLANVRGSAIGVNQLTIGNATTTQGAVTTLALGSTSFSLSFMTGSELNFRLFPSGASAANSQRRVQFGWINNLLSSTTHILNDQTSGLYFEMSATNANWRICAASASTRTIYTTATPINSASFTNFSIIVTGSLAPTASFYINDAIVGVISSTMPTRLQPVTVGIKQVRLTGTLNPCNVFVDFVELMYEMNR